MKPITDYNELLSLTSKQLKPGVITNAVFTKEEYEREIENGLQAESTDSYLLMLTDRGTHYVLYFFLQRGAVLPVIQTDKPVVTEYASRNGEKLQTENGVLLFSRQRMVRSASVSQDGGASVNTASTSDLTVCRKLLDGNFDALTGCLPGDAELLTDIKNGNVFIAENLGILHAVQKKGYTEIRHLAVDKSARNRGTAQSLLHFLTLKTELPCKVWVRCDNTPALNFYEKNGFTFDRMMSDVYRFD